MGWDEVKKARQRLSREDGTIIKDWGGRLPIALVYPNSYYIGMSNLGLHLIYGLLNSRREVVCERAFWEKENREQQLPTLSIESQRPLSDFGVLAFSISYELDFFNVVQLLKTSGIPLYAADRDEGHPVVIAGGACIIANPVPLSPFFDGMCIGEAEAILPLLLPLLFEGIKEKRHDLLKTLASLPGVYVPLINRETPVVRQWAGCLDDFSATSIILTPDTELGDLFLIEVERGCNRGCRFCLAGSAFHPMRCRSIDKVLTLAELGLKQRNRLGLVGAAVSDFPRIDELLVKLRHMGAELSISSLRMKPLSTIALQEMAEAGARSIALAPEAGSQRLRRVIKKGISEYDILKAVSQAAKEGIKQLKLYFMVGLPSESDEDIEEIINLTVKCRDIIDQQRSGCRIVLNVAPFVPKAGTPFQWLPMTQTSVLNRRLSTLKNNLVPKGIKLKGESPAWSQVQGVLSRGDTKLAEALAEVQQVSLSGWRHAMAKCHLDMDYYSYRRWNSDERLPWAILDSGIALTHLKRELEMAMTLSSVPLNKDYPRTNSERVSQ